MLKRRVFGDVVTVTQDAVKRIQNYKLATLRSLVVMWILWLLPELDVYSLHKIHIPPRAPCLLSWAWGEMSVGFSHVILILCPKFNLQLPRLPYFES